MIAADETTGFFSGLRAVLQAQEAAEHGKATPEQLRLLADVDRQEEEDMIPADSLPLLNRWTPYKD